MHKEIVHKGLKKYKCDKCNKSFATSGNLKIHNEIIHEGLKKIKCTDLVSPIDTLL